MTSQVRCFLGQCAHSCLLLQVSCPWQMQAPTPTALSSSFAPSRQTGEFPACGSSPLSMRGSLAAGGGSVCFQGRWFEPGLGCSGTVTLPGAVCLYERKRKSLRALRENVSRSCNSVFMGFQLSPSAGVPSVFCTHIQSMFGKCCRAYQSSRWPVVEARLPGLACCFPGLSDMEGTWAAL